MPSAESNRQGVYNIPLGTVLEARYGCFRVTVVAAKLSKKFGVDYTVVSKTGARSHYSQQDLDSCFEAVSP